MSPDYFVTHLTGSDMRKEPPRKNDKPPIPDKDGLVLTLSPGNLEMFKRPEGYCSAFRKVLALITAGEELIAFWKANEETVIRLREAYPRLKTTKGVHYAQILGELYTQRLQDLAQSHVHNPPANRNPLLGVGSIDKTALAIPTQRVIRDKDHLRSVAAQPCLVCGRQPAQAHHLRFMQPRAMGRKVSDEWTVPLCAIHHRQLHDAGDERRWWAERQIEPAKTAEALWAGRNGVPPTEPDAEVERPEAAPTNHAQPAIANGASFRENISRSSVAAEHTETSGTARQA